MNLAQESALGDIGYGWIGVVFMAAFGLFALTVAYRYRSGGPNGPREQTQPAAAPQRRGELVDAALVARSCHEVECLGDQAMQSTTTAGGMRRTSWTCVRCGADLGFWLQSVALDPFTRANNAAAGLLARLAVALPKGAPAVSDEYALIRALYGQPVVDHLLKAFSHILDVESATLRVKDPARDLRVIAPPKDNTEQPERNEP